LAGKVSRSNGSASVTYEKSARIRVVIVENNAVCNKVLDILSTQKILVIDVETNGLNPFKNQLCGIGVGIASGMTYYFPFRHQQGDNLSADALKNLVEVCSSASILIGYNIKFDLKFLMNEGLDPWNKALCDVPIAVRLGFPQYDKKEFGLKNIAESFYGVEAVQYDVDTKALLRRNKWLKDFSLSPPSILGPYCENDVSLTRKVYYHALQEIRAFNQEKLWKMECKLTEAYLLMERIGIEIDQAYCLTALAKIDNRQKELRERIYEIAGHEFNINSSTYQLADVFRELGVKSPRLTPTGRESWDEGALFKIDHPLAGYVKEYRTLEKWRGTYLVPCLGLRTAHTQYRLWGTSTGRISSSEPNLQNEPRDPIAVVDMVLTADEKRNVKDMLRARANVKIKKGEDLMNVVQNPR
jgi:DNA polymerase-1